MMRTMIGIAFVVMSLAAVSITIEEQYEGFRSDLSLYRAVCGRALEEDADFDAVRCAIAKPQFVELFNKYSKVKSDVVFANFEKTATTTMKRCKEPAPPKPADDSMVKMAEGQIEALKKDKSDAAKAKLVQVEKMKQQFQKMVDEENDAARLRYEKAVSRRKTTIHDALDPFVYAMNSVERAIKAEVEKLEGDVKEIRRIAAEKEREERAAAAAAARRRREAEEAEAARIAEANKPKPTKEQEARYQFIKAWYREQLDYYGIEESFYTVSLLTDVEELRFSDNRFNNLEIIRFGKDLNFSSRFLPGFAWELIRARRAIDDYEVAYCGKKRLSAEEEAVEDEKRRKKAAKEAKEREEQRARDERKSDRVSWLRSQISDAEDRISNLPPDFNGATASDIATRGRLKKKIAAWQRELERLEGRKKRQHPNDYDFRPVQ